MKCSPPDSSVHGILQARILQADSLLSEPPVYIMDYYSAIKYEIVPFGAKWVDLEIIILSEVSQIQKDKYHIISLICGL